MKMYAAFTFLCGIILFGSLVGTFLSDNGVYFLVGYPLSIVLLFCASRTKHRI